MSPEKKLAIFMASQIQPVQVQGAPLPGPPSDIRVNEGGSSSVGQPTTAMAIEMSSSSTTMVTSALPVAKLALYGPVRARTPYSVEEVPDKNPWRIVARNLRDKSRGAELRADRLQEEL